MQGRNSHGNTTVPKAEVVVEVVQHQKHLPLALRQCNNLLRLLAEPPRGGGREGHIASGPQGLRGLMKFDSLRTMKEVR